MILKVIHTPTFYWLLLWFSKKKWRLFWEQLVNFKVSKLNFVTSVSIGNYDYVYALSNVQHEDSQVTVETLFSISFRCGEAEAPVQGYGDSDQRSISHVLCHQGRFTIHFSRSTVHFFTPKQSLKSLFDSDENKCPFGPSVRWF